MPCPRSREHRAPPPPPTTTLSSSTERNLIQRILRIGSRDEPGLERRATNPPSWPGESGRAVVLPSDLQSRAQQQFKLHQFNLVASDQIAINRSLSDVRMSQCRDKASNAMRTECKFNYTSVFCTHRPTRIRQASRKRALSLSFTTRPGRR